MERSQRVRVESAPIEADERGYSDIASKSHNLPNLVHPCISMARIFALVFVAFTGVQAIRSEDDLHEGTMQHSSGIEKDVAKMVCDLGFKWEWPAYPQLGQKEHPCCEEAKKCVEREANAACPTECNLKVAGILDNKVWLPDSCVSPASQTPPEGFTEGKLNNKPAEGNAAVKAFEGKKLVVEKKGDKLVC
eukprot:symbB.v1.2.027987.t1/scaffold2917.1/size67260/2